MLGRQLEGVPPNLPEKVAPAHDQHRVRWGHHHPREAHEALLALPLTTFTTLVSAGTGKGTLLARRAGEASSPEVPTEMPPAVVVAAVAAVAVVAAVAAAAAAPTAAEGETKAKTFATSAFAIALALGLLLLEGRLAAWS